LPIHRNIRINNLKSLYDNQDYPKLIEILSESLINVDVVSDSSISHITVQTQIEILLEALWATEHVEVVSFFAKTSMVITLFSHPGMHGVVRKIFVLQCQQMCFISVRLRQIQRMGCKCKFYSDIH
jgi:hypothetical protein